MLASGHKSDNCERYSRLADFIVHESLRKFSTGVVSVFEADWLRLPNDEELAALSCEYHSLGFPVAVDE